MTRFWGVEESEKKNKPSFFSAFTLAEMMVVMLILSIVLAAMAPVMTTRYKSKPNNSSPWVYESNNRINAWFGSGPAQHAMIGQSSYGADDTIAKLLITVGDDTTNFLAFKRNNTNIGRLFIGGTNLLLGNLASGTLGNGSVGIGRNLQTSANSTAVGSSTNASGASSIAVGQGSNASAENSVAIGSEAKAENYKVDDSNTILSSGAIAIGQSSEAKAARAVAIGNGAKVANQNVNAPATGSIAIGTTETVYGDGAIAIGYDAEAKGSVQRNNGSVSVISIGKNAKATGYHALAIGEGAQATGRSNIRSGTTQDLDFNWGFASIAIGANANAVVPAGTATSDTTAKTQRVNAIALGDFAKANAADSMALGMNANVSSGSSGSIAIGYGADASATSGYSIALGKYSKASGANSIAIGSGDNSSTLWTEASGTSSIAIGERAKVEDKRVNGTYYGQYTDYTGGIAIGEGSSAVGQGVAIGRNACSNVTGSNKICIGANSGPIAGTDWASDSQERIFIGSKSKFNNGAAVLEVHNTLGLTSLGNNPTVPTAAVVINGNLVVKGSIIAPVTEISGNSKRPKGGTITSLFAQEGGSRKILRNDTTELYNYTSGFPGDFIGAYSDRRLKYVGKEITSGLDKIRQLKIFNYTYKKDTTKTPHVGVIAQDLQKVFPNAVKKGADGFLTIRMEDMFYAVINAIKELDAKYQAQEKRITAIEKENKELKARLDRLEAKVK